MFSFVPIGDVAESALEGDGFPLSDMEPLGNRL